MGTEKIVCLGGGGGRGDIWASEADLLHEGDIALPHQAVEDQQCFQSRLRIHTWHSDPKVS